MQVEKFELLAISILLLFILLIVALIALPNKENEKNIYKLSSGNKVYIDCIEGYKFISQRNSILMQIYDDEKKALRCINQATTKILK